MCSGVKRPVPTDWRKCVLSLPVQRAYAGKLNCPLVSCTVTLSSYLLLVDLGRQVQSWKISWILMSLGSLHSQSVGTGLFTPEHSTSSYLYLCCHVLETCEKYLGNSFFKLDHFSHAFWYQAAIAGRASKQHANVGHKLQVSIKYLQIQTLHAVVKWKRYLQICFYGRALITIFLSFNIQYFFYISSTPANVS